MALCSLVGTLTAIFGPTLYMIQQLDDQSADLRLNIPSRTKIVEVKDLRHEELFRATIKSCLPLENKNCKTFLLPPDNDALRKQLDENNDDEEEKSIASSHPVQRIAIITPPGATASTLIHRAEKVMFQHNRQVKQQIKQMENMKEKASQLIQLLPRPHVPPYGYGKTHGLTKIIRLVPQPLALAVTDALQAMLLPGETYADVTLLDLKAAMRQLLRFHCRLSHVSAHTAMQSIFSVDLLANAGEVAKKLQDFMLFQEGDHGNRQEEPDDAIYEMTADDDQEGLFDAQASYASQILTHLQRHSMIEIHEFMDVVLMEELKLTKNMTVWPCPSFWSVGEEPDTAKISPLIQRLAAELSPDCNDPLASCWVERDKCEAKRDAPCRGSR